MARGKWHQLRLGFEQLSQHLDRLYRDALPNEISADRVSHFIQQQLGQTRSL